jgi:hypothetical protein
MEKTKFFVHSVCACKCTCLNLVKRDVCGERVGVRVEVLVLRVRTAGVTATLGSDE